MDCHTQRLKHCAIGVAQRVWNRKETARRPGQPFAQAAVICAVPGKMQSRTKVWVAFSAVFALLARDSWINGHALTGFGYTRKLVAQHKLPCQTGIANARFAEPVQVGAAQTDRRDPHQRLIRAGGGGWLIVQAHVTY